MANKDSERPAAGCATRSLVAFAMLMPVALAVYAGREGPPQADALLPQPRSTLNPNLAPWYELTALPRVGETVAKKIVTFRETRGEEHDTPAFARPVDLDAVHGIGVKTVQRMAPHLDFDPRPQS